MITYCATPDRMITTTVTYTVPDDQVDDLVAALERTLPMTGHYWREDTPVRSPRAATEAGEHLLAWYTRRISLDTAIETARTAIDAGTPLPAHPDLWVMAEGYDRRMVWCDLLDRMTHGVVRSWAWEPPLTVDTDPACERAWRDVYGTDIDLLWLGWRPGPPAGMVSAAGAARLLGVGRSSLRTYIARGLAPDWTGPGGDRWWYPATLRAWQEQRRGVRP